ncbi:MAG: serine protease, partial [Acidobacteria bacterium]
FVSKRSRNVELAESAVRQSKSFTDQEALNQRLIDLVAKDQSALFDSLEGKTIHRFDGAIAMLHLRGDTIKLFPMTVKQQILNALYAEFNHPGAVVPGVVGVVFVLLAIFAFNLLPTRFAALVLILGAFVLFGLEIKFATHGALGLGGVVIMVIGALLLVDGPIPEMRVKLATALAVSIPFALITTFLMTVALRARRNKVQTGVQGLLGQIALVSMPLAPEGKVELMGETWNAVSSSPVGVGARVRVHAVNGLQLEVEPESQIPVVKLT